MTSRSRPRRVGDWATLGLAILIVLFGVIFVGGGGYLLSLGGSPYYLLCGIVVLASGALMAMGRLLGAIFSFSPGLAHSSGPSTKAVWISGAGCHACLARRSLPFWCCSACRFCVVRIPSTPSHAEPSDA
ncbi:hypothetical protein [Asaia astilbis]|uniref:hypothetical protein n=1 Tax=Asaia astilbis TaxID=610244 RepID=UPI00277D0B4C|nr:hypothetical protein [Asaia astilbis]